MEQVVHFKKATDKFTKKEYYKADRLYREKTPKKIAEKEKPPAKEINKVTIKK